MKLKDISTRAPKSFDKSETKEKMATLLDELDELQNLLYASATHGILVVVQGMDASGKDGLTRDVFGHINPQGVLVKSFKAPTADELAHDFLWRIHQHTPAKGMIQIFNRSHYEDVLITRVHNWIDDDTAYARMKSINHFESLLQENGTVILKFYLHISPEEQQSRLAERLHNPKKMWKYNENDLKEAEQWDHYRDAYEDVLKECDKVPWDIIPADQNWYKSYLVADRLLHAMKDLKMQYPGIKK